METGVSYTALDPDSEERFVSLRRALGVTSFGLNQILLRPGQRGRIHRHAHQEEVYVVLAGAARIKVEDEVVELRPYDALRVAPGTPRAMEGGPDGAELLAFGAPNTENKDAEMLPDWWTG